MTRRRSFSRSARPFEGARDGVRRGPAAAAEAGSPTATARSRPPLAPKAPAALAAIAALLLATGPAPRTQAEERPSIAGATADAAPPAPACAEGITLATGRPDPALFAREASRGVVAFWCETYDHDGHARREGPYWDFHPDGTLRTRGRYVEGRIEGPVEVFDGEGTLWLRGELVGGAWSGAFELFHANGSRWLAARFRDGRLDGPVETWFSDGRLESTTRFQSGREDGVASSYYPTASGGGLRSRVRVEADEIIEREEAPLAGASTPNAIAGSTGERRRSSTPIPMVQLEARAAHRIDDPAPTPEPATR